LVTGEPGTAALAPPHSQVPEQRHEEVPWPSPLHDENLAFPESRPDYSALARAVRDGIDAAKRYPLLARQAGIEGRTLLKFKLLRSGAVIELRVLESSGHAMLDQAAMGAVKRAAPFPEQGSGISGESIEVILPIVFRLQ
jgi:protein TonB